jgi:hypothetical protein
MTGSLDMVPTASIKMRYEAGQRSYWIMEAQVSTSAGESGRSKPVCVRAVRALPSFGMLWRTCADMRLKGPTGFRSTGTAKTKSLHPALSSAQDPTFSILQPQHATQYGCTANLRQQRPPHCGGTVSVHRLPTTIGCCNPRSPDPRSDMGSPSGHPMGPTCLEHPTIVASPATRHRTACGKRQR